MSYRMLLVVLEWA